MRSEFKAVLRRSQRTILTRRSGGFAQAIIARYSAIEKRWPLMALIFEQPSQGDSAVTNNYQVSHPSFFISPRILLRMLVKQETQHSNIVVSSAKLLFNNTGVMQKFFLENAKTETISVSSEEFITRILSRSVRNEIVDEIRRIRSTSASELQETFVADSEINSPLVFKRGDRSTQDSINNSATSETKTTQKKSSNISSADMNLSPPSIDISRITDQVMQALDKRIVAQRERMGGI